MTIRQSLKPAAVDPWPSPSQSCKMISWNAAALFQMDPNKALIKNHLVAKMSTVNDILMFQETHGDENDLRARCPQVAESHWCA